MDHTPLDAPITTSKTTNRAQKIFLTIEVLFWAIAGFALLLKAASLFGGDEFLIIAMTMLMLLYLFFPIFLFGSKGWLRGIGSHLVGFSLTISAMAWLFKIERWQNATEMGVTSGLFSVVAIVGVVIVVLLKRSRWTDDSFYKHVFFRLLVAVLFTSAPFFNMFFSLN
ncbi:MAG TPA: hypothetical protein PK228_03210 [Saprospiraceae bacterium]|nr:hypothetical protein [Saprospiraceae bacterium]